MDENNHSIDGQTVWSPSADNTNANNCNTSQSTPNTRTSEPTKYITPNIHIQRKLPARAVVNKQRIPNAYDKTALKLEVIYCLIQCLIDFCVIIND